MLLDRDSSHEYDDELFLSAYVLATSGAYCAKCAAAAMACAPPYAKAVMDRLAARRLFALAAGCCTACGEPAEVIGRR